MYAYMQRMYCMYCMYCIQRVQFAGIAMTTLRVSNVPFDGLRIDVVCIYCHVLSLQELFLILVEAWFGCLEWLE